MCVRACACVCQSRSATPPTPVTLLTLEQLHIKMDNGEDPTRSQEQPVDEQHPWPYLKERFEFVGAKNNSWRMRCILCKPKLQEVFGVQEQSVKPQETHKVKSLALAMC